MKLMGGRCTYLLWFWFLGAVHLCLAGCAKKEGDTCEGQAMHCLNEKEALSCGKGKLVKIACGGKGGCKQDEKNVSCDVSANKPGSACSESLEGQGACSEDNASLVLCQKGKFLDVPCRGKKGCRKTDTGFDCDNSLASLGDTCVDGQGAVCAVNGKSRLSCADGEMQKDMDCLGKQGCRTEGKKVLCDLTVARKGGRCEGEGAACSRSGKSLLLCKDGKFVHERDCAQDCKVKPAATQGARRAICP